MADENLDIFGNLQEQDFKDSQEYYDNVKGLANTAETVSLK